MTLLLVAIALAALSGVPGLFCARQSSIGQWLSVILAVVGGSLGIGAALAGLSTEPAPEVRLPWAVPGGEFHVALDALSAVFLLPVFLVSLLGSIYGLGYWKQQEHPDNGRRLRLFYGLLTAGMALLVIARNGILFLTAWEVMALSAF